jgi:hypothetical protein
MVARATVKVGDVLYDVHRTRDGIGRSVMGWWDVKILAVDEHGVTARWNGNRERRYSWRQVEKWRRNRPKPRA